MKDWRTWTLIVVTAAFAVARFVVPVKGAIEPEDVFKDLAHLWVGFLFGFAVDPIIIVWNGGVEGWRRLTAVGKVVFALPFLLTIVEVVAFAARKAS